MFKEPFNFILKVNNVHLKSSLSDGGAKEKFEYGHLFVMLKFVLKRRPLVLKTTRRQNKNEDKIC